MSSAKPTLVRWRIMGLLILASFISYILRYNMSIAGPTLVGDLGLTEAQFGYVLAAFSLGYVLFQFPGGLLVERFGARRVLTFAMMIWGSLTLVTALVPANSTSSPVAIMLSLMLIRFFVGLSHAPIYPLTGGVVERWFPPGSWALPNGLTSTAITVGITATTASMAWMMVHWGWRLSFALFAPLAFGASALWWWYVRDNPEQHSRTNDSEVALILGGRQPASTHPDKVKGIWLRVLKDRNVLLLTTSYFCTNYVFYQMFNYAYYYLVSVRDVAGQQAGLMTSSQWICGAVGAALGGYLCDRLCRRYNMNIGCKWMAIVTLVVAALLLLAGAFAVNPVVAVAAMAACFLFQQLSEGAYWAAAISVGGRHSSTACGLMNTGGNLAGVVNALLVPATAAVFGWTAALSTAGLFALLAAVLWLFIRADETIVESADDSRAPEQALQWN